MHGREAGHHRKVTQMFYNVIIADWNMKLTEKPVTRKEAKQIAENYSGAKIVKVSGPYANGKPVHIEESHQNGWVFVTYLTGERGELVAAHSIEYK